jgi:quercetin 2,3-dioxygenase
MHDDIDIWQAEQARVGATPVLRALPHPTAEAVGPSVFLDHFGPVPTRPGTLPAHPHAGIEVMTYLMAGASEHRDSAGHIGQVQAGGAQWMRAGRGVLHSERILAEAPIVHGLQFWARMPVAMQDDPPSYRGILASEVPTWVADGVTFRLLAGTWQGHTGPITLALPAFMLHLTLSPGHTVTVDLPVATHDYGAYAVESPENGLQLANGRVLPRGSFAHLNAEATALSVTHAAGASAPAEVFILGGEPAPRPLVFGGPFVFESRAALQRANERYAAGEMGTLDGVPF